MNQATKDYLAAGGAGGAAVLLLLAAWRLKRPKLRCEVTITTDLPLDDYAPVEPVTTCDPDPKPGVLAFKDMVLQLAEGTDAGISRDCSIGADSKHHEGRAWDWGPPSRQAGDSITRCLTAPDAEGRPDALARRAGLRVIIWQRRIWTAGTRRWLPYAKPGGDPHTTHVHFDFSWKGANAQTSLYSILEDGQAQAEAELDPGPSRYLELLAARGLGETTNHFRVRLVEVAEGLGLDPSMIALVISHETGGKFAPGYYPSSHRVGLLQWNDASAAWIGTSAAQLRAMSATAQLEYVGRWFKKARGFGAITRPVDYRLVPFAPAAIGKPMEAVIYDTPALVAANVGFDRDRDGKITVGEVAASFDESIAAAKKRPPVIVDMQDARHKAASAAIVLAALASAGCAVYLDKADR